MVANLWELQTNLVHDWFIVNYRVEAATLVHKSFNEWMKSMCLILLFLFSSLTYFKADGI